MTKGKTLLYQYFRNFIVLSFMALILFGCGRHEAEVQAPEGAQPFKVDQVKIAGKEFKLYTATTHIERLRAERFVDLRDENQAALFLYGNEGNDSKEERVLDIQPDFAFPADLLFLNRKQEVVKVYAGPEQGYMPFGITNRESGYENGPNFYGSDRPASGALLLPYGSAEKLGIQVGLKLNLPEKIFSKITQADGNKLVFYFTERGFVGEKEEQSGLPEPPSLRARVATTSEDRSRNILKDDDALLMLYRKQDSSWFRNGYWLKGIEGKVSFAFMRLIDQKGGKGPLFGNVLDIIEGVEDQSGLPDLERPRWWPSSDHITSRDENPQNRRFELSGPVNALLIVRGDKPFTDRKIKEDMSIITSSITLSSPSSWSNNGLAIEKDSFLGLGLEVGAKNYGIHSIVQRRAAINAALSRAGALRHDEASVLVWDSIKDAEAHNASPRAVKLALLAPFEENTSSIKKILTLEPGKRLSSKELGLSSRFALLFNSSQEGLKEGSKISMPWQVVAMKPSLRSGAFYRGEEPEKHFTSVPDDKLAMVQLEVADTDPAIMQGLMGRKSLPQNQGMLFIFKEPSFHKFWMKNCLMDIDVAFITEDFRVVALHEMKKPKPGTPDSALDTYPSKGNVKYAVEMEGGWFKAHAIKKGDRFWLPSPLMDRLSE